MSDAPKTRKTFKNRLIVYRTARNLSQEEMADEFGVGRGTLSGWENGEPADAYNKRRIWDYMLNNPPDQLSLPNIAIIEQTPEHAESPVQACTDAYTARPDRFKVLLARMQQHIADKGITRSGFAQAVGVPPSVVCKFSDGLRLPRGLSLWLLDRYLTDQEKPKTPVRPHVAPPAPRREPVTEDIKGFRAEESEQKVGTYRVRYTHQGQEHAQVLTGGVWYRIAVEGAYRYDPPDEVMVLLAEWLIEKKRRLEAAAAEEEAARVRAEELAAQSQLKKELEGLF